MAREEVRTALLRRIVEGDSGDAEEGMRRGGSNHPRGVPRDLRPEGFRRGDESRRARRGVAGDRDRWALDSKTWCQRFWIPHREAVRVARDGVMARARASDVR